MKIVKHDESVVNKGVDINHKANKIKEKLYGGKIMGIGLKVTITGLLIRMFQASTISKVSDMYPVLNNVFFIASIVICVIGIVITLFEIPEHPVKSIISEIAQIAGSICLIANTELARDLWTIVIGTMLIYGLIQALIHGNLVYVVYFLW